MTPDPAAGPTVEGASDALTDLSAYAMTLDAEYFRLEGRLVELANSESGAAELRAALREREEIAAERDAFRFAVAALRERITYGPCFSRRT